MVLVETQVLVVMLMAAMAAMAIVVTVFVAPWGPMEERPLDWVAKPTVEMVD